MQINVVCDTSKANAALQSLYIFLALDISEFSHFRMVKETAKGGVSSALAPKAGTAHPENTPDCLKKLEETLKFNVLDSNADISEGLEIDMVGGVEQVLLGAAKSQQFVAVLRTAGVTPEHKSVNLAIVNAMWIWGTQVSAQGGC